MGKAQSQQHQGAVIQDPAIAAKAINEVSVPEVSGRLPCVYIAHGGGPMPLMGKQPDIAEFLLSYPASLAPRAVLVVTAHWETRRTTVSAAERPKLLFDYGGFPPETYAYEYPAPGSPAVANRVKELLEAKGLACDLDTRRGWDHGTFVPMMCMFPEARLPIVQVSLLDSQNAASQIAVGAALAPLRDEGVLIVGSGMSFHNFKYLFASGSTRATGEAHGKAFDDWLVETVTSNRFTDEERRARLAAWEQAPSAREAHPPGAAEHLTPLFAIFGAAGAGPAGRKVGKKGSGMNISQFEFK